MLGGVADEGTRGAACALELCERTDFIYVRPHISFFLFIFYFWVKAHIFLFGVYYVGIM